MTQIQVTVNNPAFSGRETQTVLVGTLIGELKMQVNGSEVTLRSQVESGKSAVSLNGEPTQVDQPVKDGDQVTAAPRKVGMATA